MDTHVKIASILHIVFGAFGFLLGLITLVFFGGTSLFFFMAHENDPNIHMTMPIIMLALSIIVFFMFITSIPGMLTGFGMMYYHNWGRILGIVLSILYIPFNFPLGTLLGAYTLWVLFSRETIELFRNQGRYNSLKSPPHPPSG